MTHHLQLFVVLGSNKIFLKVILVNAVSLGMYHTFEIKHPLQQLHSKEGVGLRIFEGGPILGGYFLHYSRTMLYQFMTYIVQGNYLYLLP